jgi:zinc protease
VFRNGLTVLVNEHRAHPVVSIQTYVLTGFADERAGGLGYASLVAALTQRGAGDPKSGTFRQQAQTLGGFFRRSMHYDHTRFEISAASPQWKRALNLQIKALLKPSFDSDIVKLEAKMVSDKARAVLDDPSAYAREKLLALGFGSPEMARNSVLADAELREVDLNELVEFHKTRYTPNQIIVVISGDVRASDTLNEFAKVYEQFPTADSQKASLNLQNRQTEFRYLALRGHIAHPRVLFGFHTVSENSEDYPAVEVLGAMLGLGEGSVFTSRLRDQKGLIFQQNTKHLSYPDAGYLAIEFLVDPVNIDRSQIAALTEIELLKREGPNEIELARAVAQLELSFWKRLETVSGRAQALARFERLGDWKGLDRYVSKLRDVTASDVKRVANRYLQLRNCSLIEYLPDSEEERNLTSERVLSTLEGLLAPAADEEQAARDKEIINFELLPSGTEDFNFSEVKYPFRLASILRGPEMFIREDHTLPLIELGVFFPGGKISETQENSGITELLAHLILGGTEDQSRAEFNRRMEVLGGRLRPIIADDYFGFVFSILSKNFGRGFDLLRQSVKTPNLQKGSVDRQKSIQAALLRECESSEEFQLQQLYDELFGDFPYSLYRKGNEASLSRITQDAVQAWYEAFVKNRKPIAVIIGDAKGTSLAAYFVQHFSGSRMKSAEIPEEYAKSLEAAASSQATWKKSRSLIFIGFQAPPLDDEDVHAAMLLESFAGMLGRFAQELRDRSGVAFNINTVYRPRLRGGSFVIRATTSPGNEEAVLQSLREEIERIRKNSTTRLEYRSAQNAAIGNFRIHTQYRFRQMIGIVEKVLAGRGIQAYERFEEGLRGVGEDQFKEVTGRILNLNRAAIWQIHGQSR